MPDDIIFLPMTDDDISQVAEIEKESFSLPWSESSFKEMLVKDDAPYLVGKIGDKVVAYMGSCIVGDESFINQVAVSEEYRGQGIGTALLRSYIKLLIAKSVRAATLEVRVSNMAAIRMYEKCGFKAEGVRKNFYEKPDEDALILWNTELIL